ncbi:MmpS family transport accessory protein, partial [Mycolicibacterium diernhoferi]
MKGLQRDGVPTVNVLKRVWIPLVIVAVVLVATFTVMRVRTFFGTGPGYISTENSASDDTE